MIINPVILTNYKLAPPYYYFIFFIYFNGLKLRTVAVSNYVYPKNPGVRPENSSAQQLKWNYRTNLNT